MKISKSLLAKYAQGTCNPEEKHFVENWLDAQESLGNVNDEGEFKKFHDETWGEIARILGFGKPRILPSPGLFLKYAAAACIIFGAFIGGRVTASSGSKGSHLNTLYEEHLYLTGGNNLMANLPGERFKLKFEGTLQLFNASDRDQFIVSGGTTLVLKSGVVYYLMGSTDKPQLIEEIVGYPNVPDASNLSIRRIDDK